MHWLHLESKWISFNLIYVIRIYAFIYSEKTSWVFPASLCSSIIFTKSCGRIFTQIQMLCFPFFGCFTIFIEFFKQNSSINIFFSFEYSIIAEKTKNEVLLSSKCSYSSWQIAFLSIKFSLQVFLLWMLLWMHASHKWMMYESGCVQRYCCRLTK